MKVDIHKPCWISYTVDINIKDQYYLNVKFNTLKDEFLIVNGNTDSIFHYCNGRCTKHGDDLSFATRKFTYVEAQRLLKLNEL